MIFSKDAHYPHDSEVVNKWEPNAINGTSGGEVIPELGNSGSDYIVEEGVYSAPFETGPAPEKPLLRRGRQERYTLWLAHPYVR